MSATGKLSVVLPVRDNQHDVVDRVERVLDALAAMTRDVFEVVVVDDGSRDATAQVLKELESRHSQVRIARHSRPRGMEAAGQTGLERATGEIVFIQESNTDVRIDDLHRLHQMTRDYSIVAARAESTPRPLSPSLLRRLRAFGTNADKQLKNPEVALQKSSMQMIRRPHLQQLAGPIGDDYDSVSYTHLTLPTILLV